MTRQFFLLLGTLSLVTMILVACGGQSASQGTPTPTYPPVPAEYANLKPPFDLTNAQVIAQGKAIYTSDCAPCHGANGLGDGPAAAGLTPHPINFASAFAKDMTPQFRFWRISEGVPDTAMPSWKGTLTTDQIWQVISYEMTFAK